MTFDRSLEEAAMTLVPPVTPLNQIKLPGDPAGGDPPLDAGIHLSAR